MPPMEKLELKKSSTWIVTASCLPSLTAHLLSHVLYPKRLYLQCLYLYPCCLYIDHSLVLSLTFESYNPPTQRPDAA